MSRARIRTEVPVRGARWLLAAAVGCGGPQGSVDTAMVCAGDGGEGGSVAVEVADGDTLALIATATGGCHTDDLAVTCDVDLQGTTLVLTTETTWVDSEPLSMNCEFVLLTAQATCETPPLPTGSYTIVYGADELGFSVPGAVTGCLDGA